MLVSVQHHAGETMIPNASDTLELAPAQMFCLCESIFLNQIVGIIESLQRQRKVMEEKHCAS